MVERFLKIQLLRLMEKGYNMIRLENVNKYFNRYKKNQIHVINDTSIDLSSSGLVALLGPSGCGKTTLLNVIGGLDKVSSGKVFVDGKNISKKRIKKIDEIRTLNIGYIFQDYKLIEDMSVFENVALSLKLIGFKDEKVIKERVLYTLDKVKMFRYKNRPVSMLSGGERQRVGIARALVKNPKIIIADEPTGNLDSKNTLEIMNIIKSISSKYLVILVTHEVELAKFYSDRIIEIEDGKVLKDYYNITNRTLDYKIDNKIYLKDLKYIDKIKQNKININVYREDNIDIRLNIVVKNGNIYIETENKESVEQIGHNSNIELVNDHYKEIEKIEINEDIFQIENFDNAKHKLKYSSIFKLGSYINYGFKKVFGYSVLKKILLGGFFISGLFAFYSIASIFATINIKDSEFITMDKDYLIVSGKKITPADFAKIEQNEDILYAFPGKSLISLKFNYDKFLQTQNDFDYISGSLTDINTISKSDLFLGRLPNNLNEIVIDKMVLDTFLKESNAKMAGFINLDDLLNHEVIMANMDDLKIVGISNTMEPNIYTNSKIFLNLMANSAYNSDYEYEDYNKKDVFIDYDLTYNKSIKIVKGRLPINDYEVLVNETFQYEMPLNKTINTKINNKKLTVVGYYKNISANYIDEMFVNKNTIKINLIANNQVGITVYGNNKEEIINYFQDNNYNVYDSYEHSKNSYIEGIKEDIISSLVLSLVILGISLIEILLMIRSSFLSRIKEVGIYRALGIKKSDIYKMFAGEIIAITVLASLPGVSFMAYILHNLSKVSYFANMFMVNSFTYLVTVIIILIFNLLVGLIPVYNTIKKRPAEILSRLDLE